MKRLAQRHRDRLVAVPAQLDDRRLERGDAQRELEARRRAAGVNHDVRAVAHGLGPREPDAERLRDGRPPRVEIDEFHVAPVDASRQPRSKAADGARADHHETVANPGVGVPQAVDRRFEVGASTARGGGTFSGIACTAAAGTTYRV